MIVNNLTNVYFPFIASNIKETRKLYHQRKAKQTRFSSRKIKQNDKQARAELCQAQLSLGQLPTNHWLASCDEKAYAS